MTSQGTLRWVAQEHAVFSKQVVGEGFFTLMQLARTLLILQNSSEVADKISGLHHQQL